MSDENNKEKTFADLGLSIEYAKTENLVVGDVYPLYGMITKILDENNDFVLVELNFSIEAKMFILEEEKRQKIKEKSFEPGIFVSTIMELEPKIKVECTTVIFGKPNSSFVQ